LFLRIVEALADDVSGGRLPAGTRLPPQRDLAHILGVSLNTVSRAYAEAAARGFTEGEVGRGTYVRAPGPRPTTEDPASLNRPASGPIDFSRNLPPPGQASALLARTLATLAGDADLSGMLDTQTSSAQNNRHTRALAVWLEQVGLRVPPDSLVLTNGAQHGLLVALMASTRPGDALLTDPLTYAPLTPLARHLGVRILPVAGAEGRLNIDSLADTCARTAARVLYLTPTLHTPTATTLSTEEREALVSVARRHDLTILEDDVFGFLPPNRPPPLAALAPERVLYITSLSKTLAPGLRVGLVHGPTDRIRAVRAAVALSAWMTPPLMAEIARAWIEDGTAAHLTAHHRTETAARQALARDLLPADLLSADPHGFHAWLTLPPLWPAETFRVEAETRGVSVATAAPFAADPKQCLNAVRLCLSHETNRTRVRTGLEIVAALLRTTPPERGLVV